MRLQAVRTFWTYDGLALAFASDQSPGADSREGAGAEQPISTKYSIPLGFRACPPGGSRMTRGSMQLKTVVLLEAGIYPLLRKHGGGQ